MDSRVGYVYINDIFAGLLSETEFGYEFKYDDNYLTLKNCAPVSLTLPIQKEPFVSKTLFPFFDGIIPEGWLLDVVINNWKMDKNDRFGILLVACNDCIGNVSVRSSKQ